MNHLRLDRAFAFDGASRELGLVALQSPDGTIATVSSFTGTLSLALPLSGTCSGTSTFSGNLVGALALSGTASCASSWSGTISSVMPISGSIVGTSVFSAQVAGGIQATGLITCASTFFANNVPTTPAARTVIVPRAARATPFIISFVKAPAAELDYVLDWGLWLAPGDSVLTSVWSSSAIAVAVTQSLFTNSLCFAWTAGGTLGASYLLTNTITTASHPARVDSRTIRIQIQST